MVKVLSKNCLKNPRLRFWKFLKKYSQINQLWSPWKSFEKIDLKIRVWSSEGSLKIYFKKSTFVSLKVVWKICCNYTRLWNLFKPLNIYFFKNPRLCPWRSLERSVLKIHVYVFEGPWKYLLWKSSFVFLKVFEKICFTNLRLWFWMSLEKYVSNEHVWNSEGHLFWKYAFGVLKVP